MNLDYLQSDRITGLRDKVLATQSQQEKERLLRVLVREITNKLNDVTIGSIKDGIEVKNFDELKASLHNELNRVNKPLLDILKSFKLSSDEQTKVIEDIKTSADKYFAAEFQPIIIRRPHDKVEVTNISDISIPNALKVTNLKELESYFKSLESVVEKSLNINIPAPQVNVEASKIETKEQDFSPLLNSINSNLKKLKDNNKSNPVFVRMTDLEKILDKLDEVVRSGKSTSTAAFAGGSNQVYLRDTSGNIINPPSDPGDTLKTFANIAANTTDGNIVTAVAGKKIRVANIAAVTGVTATNITFNSKGAGAGTAATCLFANGSNGGEILPYNAKGWFDTNLGEGLTATTGSGATTGLLIGYWLI